jgi:hypothetical protein
MSQKQSVSTHQNGVAVTKKFTERELRNRIAEDLRAVFPAQLQLDFAQAAKIIGVSAGHISNKESMGCPLFPSVRVGRKRLVQAHDLVDFLVIQRLKAQVKRGPRTKAERLVGQEGGAA